MNKTKQREITWRDLVRREPGLAELLKEAQAIKDPGGPSFCANSIFYRPGGFKDRLIYLAGWQAELSGDPVLRSSEAYDLAYQKIYRALPPCRNCYCE